jgi:hypothetical protein
VVAYAALFGVFAWPGLRLAADTFPRSPFGNAVDERLVAYLLAWGAHALGTRPAALFDVPINHPAPAQLTGSEHFLSTQLLFAPVYWLTGNAVLAANLTAFAVYPLEAGAMYWLARRLGCERAVAFVAGLALALGAAQLPAHPHRLQYLVLYVPLAAGMLTRLRLEPTLGRTAALAGVCLLAFFSSYYTFVVTGVAALLWTVAEFARARPGRWRFALLAGTGTIAPALLLATFSLPYLMRPEAAGTGPLFRPGDQDLLALLAAAFAQSSGPLLRLLAVCGIVGLASGAAAARIAAARGLLFVVTGGLLMLGPGRTVGDVYLPLPFVLFAETPLRFFRYPFRFVGLVTFGRALLVAAGLQAARGVLPAWLGTALVVAVFAALLGARAPSFAATAYDPVQAVRAPVFDVVAGVTRGCRTGALLELPSLLATGGSFDTEGDTQIGQLRHWCPLVGGHTGYQPPHRAVAVRMIERLPAPMAIQTLVDMTHVDWILLRPVREWPRRLHRQREAIVRAPWAERVWAGDGWVLLRVTLQPDSDDFFTAIAAGWRPGTTALGTPVAPVPATAARATVGGALPPAMTRRLGGYAVLTVRNDGSVTWPVSVPRAIGADSARGAGEVYLQATWRREDEEAVAATFDLALPRDVRAGEALVDAYRLRLPPPGRYAVEIGVRQRNGEGFQAPASQPLRARVVVE